MADDRELLAHRDVLVVDEAGMIGTRQMERVLSEAEKRGAGRAGRRPRAAPGD